MRFIPLTSPVTTATLLAALALAGCSAERSNAPAEAGEHVASATSDAAAADDEAGPGISRAAAPGVAFAFNYAFTLPAKAISGVQQGHAAACERLGPNRCRIVGMTYEQPREDSVEARLDFRLSPDLAQRFASEGIAAVETAEGKLDRATINGEDAGSAIRLSQQDSAGLAAEVQRIEQRLAAKGLTPGERRDLQARISELNGQARDQARERGDNEASLASTPVTFVYASEGLLGGGNTFGKAASASFGSASAALSLLLLIAGIALPWIGLVALGVWGLRWIRRRQPSSATPHSAP
jgi:hypothetical protein